MWDTGTCFCIGKRVLPALVKRSTKKGGKYIQLMPRKNLCVLTLIIKKLRLILKICVLSSECMETTKDKSAYA